MTHDTSSQPANLQPASIIVRNDLSVLVTVLDQSIELHLDPLMALGLGKRLIQLGLAATADMDEVIASSTKHTEDLLCRMTK